MSNPIGYYNAQNNSVSFGTRFGPIFLEPFQIIRNNGGALVASDPELDVKVKQGILKVLHEGESESSLFFRPVKKDPKKADPNADRVVISSKEGAVKRPTPDMPTTRVSASEAPRNEATPPSPTHQQLIDHREKAQPSVATVRAADYVHTSTPKVVEEGADPAQAQGQTGATATSATATTGAPAARKISDAIEVNEAGIPLDAVNNPDGTIGFEGNKYVSAGALLKFIEATGRPTKKVAPEGATA